MKNLFYLPLLVLSLCLIGCQTNNIKSQYRDFNFADDIKPSELEASGATDFPTTAEELEEIATNCINEEDSLMYVYVLGQSLIPCIEDIEDSYDYNEGNYKMPDHKAPYTLSEVCAALIVTAQNESNKLSEFDNDMQEDNDFHYNFKTNTKIGKIKNLPEGFELDLGKLKLNINCNIKEINETSGIVTASLKDNMNIKCRLNVKKLITDYLNNINEKDDKWWDSENDDKTASQFFDEERKENYISYCPIKDIIVNYKSKGGIFLDTAINDYEEENYMLLAFDGYIASTSGVSVCDKNGKGGKIISWASIKADKKFFDLKEFSQNIDFYDDEEFSNIFNDMIEKFGIKFCRIYAVYNDENKLVSTFEDDRDLSTIIKDAINRTSKLNNNDDE